MFNRKTTINHKGNLLNINYIQKSYLTEYGFYLFNLNLTPLNVKINFPKIFFWMWLSQVFTLFEIPLAFILTYFFTLPGNLLQIMVFMPLSYFLKVILRKYSISVPYKEYIGWINQPRLLYLHTFQYAL